MTETNETSIESIKNKIDQLCNILAGGGVGSQDFISQLIYLIFLKMDQEKVELFGEETIIPKGYRWENLVSNQGEDLKDQYEQTLDVLKRESGIVGTIFAQAQNRINQSANLEKLISFINKTSWLLLDDDVKGALYESILQKYGQDKKVGAGQYFTPRPLVDVIVELVNPQIGETVTDPACGTGGFLLSAFKHMKNQSFDAKKLEFLRNSSIHGNDITDLLVTMSSMNMYLHGIGFKKSPIVHEDSLLNEPTELSKVVLANPPFGKRVSGSIDINRPDFIKKTKNNQLNFVQHIMSLLERGGRAGVVVPDNVLFDSEGASIREKLLKDFNVHTILRLPSGLFTGTGAQTNVLFFTKGQPTQDVWFYDYRTNIKHTVVENPLTREHLDDFVKCYCAENLSARKETYDKDKNPDGRWRKYSVKTLLSRYKVDLDIKWVKEIKSDEENLSMEEIFSRMSDKVVTIQNAIADLRKDLGYDL